MSGLTEVKNLMMKYRPIVVLTVFSLASFLFWTLRPGTEEQTAPAAPKLTVEAQTLAPQDYAIWIDSYGLVRPRIQSTLIAQVSGEIVSVNQNVRDGGFFEKGDLLGQIDPTDFEANVDIAAAILTDAEQSLAEAEARRNQALEDWNRLGNSGDPPPLVQRLPQLKAAQARVKSAKAQLKKARVELRRTRITAPFAGRVLRKLVDIGQVVSDGTPLAEIYAIGAVEIRLPLQNRDLPFIDLPESFRFSDVEQQIDASTLIRSDLSGPATWPAKLVRTEGSIDSSARQLHVIAEIEDPFGRASEGQAPIKVGQYVTASIPGRTIADAIVVPVGAVYQSSYVYVVEHDTLQRRAVVVTWQNGRDAVIDSGLEQGDELIVTPLGQVTSGIPVTRKRSHDFATSGGRPQAASQ